MKSDPKGAIEFSENNHIVQESKEMTENTEKWKGSKDQKDYLGIIADKLNTMPRIYSGWTEPALL